GQRHRVRPHGRLLQRGPGRDRRVARPDPSGRGVREPARRLDDWRMARGTAVRRLEGLGNDGEGGGRPVLRAAVPPRAIPNGDRRVTLQGSDLTYEGLAAHERPKIITDVPGPEAMARIERDRKVTSPSLPRAY